MKQFVPLTDDMLYRPGGPPAMLVPYQCGVVCCHRAGEEPDFEIDRYELNDDAWFSGEPSVYRRA